MVLFLLFYLVKY